MPDSSSHDDPFADLFAKLPDPRQQAPEATAAAQTPASTGTSGDAAAPLSRRAAREAASREGADAETAPAPQAPAAPTAPVAPTAPGAAAAGPQESRPTTPPPTVAMPAQPAPRQTVAAQPVADPAPPVAPVRSAAEAAATGAATAGAAAGTARAASAPSRPVSTAPTLDDLFAEEARGGPSHHTPAKKNRHVGRWIALGITLVLIGGFVGTGVWAWNTYQDKIREVMGWEEPKDYEDGIASGEALVTIADGDVPSTISKSLYQAGVTKTSSAFYDMLIKTQQNPTFYPGVYKLQKKMSATAALDALKNSANKLENSALLREGLTMDQSLSILADSLKLPLADFQAAVKNPSDYGVPAKSLEGWLFPAMYTFDPGVTAKDVIKTLVDHSIKALDDAGVPEDQREKVLTIASIIQREARFEDDFYKVSRVIENRLDPKNQETFGYLQMDSTAQYGYGEMHDGTVSSSAAALADDNPWNTYKHTGLPVGPIANPGAQAIDAAMHPADGDWLYFVTVNLDTGETVFTKTLAQHNKAVAQWQKWCKANPDSGC